MLRSLSGFLAILAAGVVEAPADDEPVPPALAVFVIPGVEARAADADAPLAEGWPKGTRPGRIELKDYPAYRSAVARGTGAVLGADNVLFFPLFKHITDRKIAMTAPVVSTYSAGLIEEPGAKGSMEMEFVYRSPTQGEVGPGGGSVKVEDHPAATYLALGVQGEIDPDRMRKAVEALRARLVGLPGGWVEDGPPRRLGYHGPMTPRDARLWEVQIPVKRAEKPKP